MVLTALIAIALVATSAADGFARYPAGPTYSGPHASLQLKHARSRRFKSALADAADGEVDFAGRYIVAEIGCGAGCIDVAAINAATGKVVWLPGSVSGWLKTHPDPLEYRTDSRMLRVYGRLAERGSSGPHDFAFDGRRFVPVSR